jgi:hypothetical protein
LRVLVFAIVVACVFSGCAHDAPLKHGPAQSTARINQLITARNADVLTGLRRQRDDRDRAFFDARIAQARSLADGGAYESALLVLDDAQHFAAMTFGWSREMDSSLTKPRAYINMRLGVVSYDRRRYELAKTLWRQALPRVATEPAARKTKIDAKHMLDVLRSGGDFDGGPTRDQDAAMQQLILAPNPPAPKRKRSIFDLFKHINILRTQPPPQNVLNVLPGTPKPSPTPSPKPPKKRRHKFLGIF